MLGEIAERTRRMRPLVHCMVNLVTANDCANTVLASGASPIMAEAPEEAAQIASMCSALVLNLGTPNPRKIEALVLAGAAARAQGKPVVFDPVGAGCSDFRREASQRILQEVRPSVIRGNASEIRTLLLGTMAARGVDADDAVPDHRSLAVALAQKTGAVVVLSGDADIVTDGRTAYCVHNGHPMMHSVTGTGCQLSVLTGAYAAASPDDLLRAALAAVCTYGLCGEIAYRRLGPLDGNASYRTYIIDALYQMTSDALENGANYAIC